jgi:AbrB family looped-hinge helix DNA binding protein
MSNMKTVLSPEGQVAIPREIRETDGLASGESFDLTRVGAGEYLLKRIVSERPKRSSIETAADGLPVLRRSGRVITSELVREIEGLPW